MNTNTQTPVPTPAPAPRVTFRQVNVNGRWVQQQSIEAVPATIFIRRLKSGQRVALIQYYGHATRRGQQVIPVELLALAAGPDAWMREIMYRCNGCGTRHPAAVMSGNFCDACTQVAADENAASDATPNTPTP